MGFTVETGSIVAGANSYVSVASADAYHTDRGNTAWTGADSVKQAALIKATDYIEQNYDGRWKGYKVRQDQPLAWPRSEVLVDRYYLDHEKIPAALTKAVCELALKSLSSELNPDLERGGAVKREKIDVIEVEYMEGASGRTVRPVIDGYLKGLIACGPNMVKVNRV